MARDRDHGRGVAEDRESRSAHRAPSPRRAALAAQLAAGALPAPAAAVAPQLIFNQRLDAWLTVIFTVILWLVILDMARVCARKLRGLPVAASCEAPYQPARPQALVLGGPLHQEGGT